MMDMRPVAFVYYAKTTPGTPQVMRARITITGCRTYLSAGHEHPGTLDIRLLHEKKEICAISQISDGNVKPQFRSMKQFSYDLIIHTLTAFIQPDENVIVYIERTYVGKHFDILRKRNI